MLREIVCIARARKDAKALSHGLNCEVISLGGIRKFEDVNTDKIPENRILFFFCGKNKEDIEIANQLYDEFSKKTICKIIQLSKKAVRNTRMEEIRAKFEEAKAEIRLFFEWDKKEEVFKFSEENKLGLEINPDYDAYFVCSNSFAENMNRVFGIDIKQGNLILRKMYNEEWIYSPCLKAVVSKKTGEELRTIRRYECEAKEAPIEKMLTIKSNEEWINKFERVSIEFLKSFRESELIELIESKLISELVDVPFSGGKDSLASLILSCKAFSPENVRAIYVKTNHELPYTEEYVEEICDKLKVELLKVEVKFSKNDTVDRACTKMKVEKLREVSNSLLIVGDRDAESRVRRLRDEIREVVGKIEVSPIKYWSGCLVQLYITKSGYRMHPLYYVGFYRLGCSICPFMGKWEEKLLKLLSKSRY